MTDTPRPVLTWSDVLARLLTHGQINAETVVGYEAGLAEGRRERDAKVARLTEALTPYFTVHMTDQGHEDGDGCYGRAASAVLALLSPKSLPAATEGIANATGGNLRSEQAAEVAALDVGRLAGLIERAVAEAPVARTTWMDVRDHREAIAAVYARLALLSEPLPEPGEAGPQ